MRVLVLHGFNGSARKILRRGASLWDAFRSRGWEVNTCDAPFPERNDRSRSWWRSAENYSGLVDSLRFLTTQRSPDVIVGFSQGAILTSIICGLRNNEDAKWAQETEFSCSILKQAKGAVLISGFQPNYVPVREAAFRKPIQIPSLHIIGEADKIVLPDQSSALAAKFVNPIILKHTEAHDIPCSQYNNEIINHISGF